MVTDSHSPIFQIMYARHSEHRVLRMPGTGLSLYYIFRQSLDNEKQRSSLRDRVTLLLGVVTEINFLESGLGLLSFILRTLSRLLLRTQYYSMLKTARRINIS